LSNVSYGLVKRTWINEAFIIAAISHGLDAAICDPTRPSIRKAIALGRMIAGKDKYCRRFTRGVRRKEFEKQP
jgi:5-methyltetrahydrofolate--homocysteine methyltransferase